MKKSELRKIIKEAIAEYKILAFGLDKTTKLPWHEVFDTQELFEQWLAINADNYMVYGTQVVTEVPVSKKLIAKLFIDYTEGK